MLKLFIFASCVFSTFSWRMEGFIVGGQDADIEDFPHSVLVKISCREVDKTHARYTCGSSIVNQQILLSAAHCFHGCTSNSSVDLFIGYAIAEIKPKRQSYAFILHQSYNPTSFQNDIMLIIMDKPLRLDRKVRRVALMSNPPYQEPGMVAGWGLTNEVDRVKSKRLKSVVQSVMRNEDCLKKFSMVQGTFCAAAKNDEGYASLGDSGSALVVRGYIQIGIISYKLPSISRKILVYTDVGYFYKWIKINTKYLFCS